MKFLFEKEWKEQKKMEIEKIAHLAKIKLTDQEKVSIERQLSTILEHFKKVSLIDTNGVEPLVTPSEIEIAWRNDEAKKNFSADEMLKNAPEKSGNLFAVPPVV